MLVSLCGYKYKCHDVHVKTSGVCAYNFRFNLSFCVTLGGSWPKATCMVLGSWYTPETGSIMTAGN